MQSGEDVLPVQGERPGAACPMCDFCVPDGLILKTVNKNVLDVMDAWVCNQLVNNRICHVLTEVYQRIDCALQPLKINYSAESCTLKYGPQYRIYDAQSQDTFGKI